MTGRIVVLGIALSGLCSVAVAGSPANPGGGGQAIAGTAATARDAGVTPGASSWGGARAAVGQGEFGGLTNHDVNVIAKGLYGGDPTPGKP